MPERKNVPIRYTSRDFASIRTDLVNYAKRYYPDSYKDFTDASFGSLMIDTVAYVGDILSFYLDYQANESFLATSIEYQNVVKHGRQLGYKPKGSSTSTGVIAFFASVPASVTGVGPDTNYIPVLQRGTELRSVDGNKFTLVHDVEFSHTNNEVIVANVNTTTGAPTFFAIKAFGTVVSGDLVEEVFTIGTAQKFLKLDLASEDVTEIISVRDSEGHEYFEVQNLSQNTIYTAVSNPDYKSDGVPSLIKRVVVPRRFTLERDGFGVNSLQFGHGSDKKLPSLSVKDPASIVLDRHAKSYFADKSFDPSNLVSSDKFGIAPADTTLRVIYRANSTDNANAAVDSVTNVARPIMKFDDFNTLDQGKVNAVIGSLECTNEEPITGDTVETTSDEVKIRVFDHHATQNRAVTAQDYIALTYAMPGEFGAIKRCNIVRDTGTLKRNLNMYVVSEGSGNKFTKTNTAIKKNLKTWLNNYRMVNDTIDILDAKVFNFGIKFTAISQVSANRFDILTQAVSALKNLFAVPFEIGEHISISNIYRTLNNLPGIADTVSVKIVHRSGAEYAGSYLDIDAHTSPDRRFVHIPGNMVAELKYPNIDITGTIR